MVVMLVSIAGTSPFAYITNYNDDTVSVIDTATDNVTATVPVGDGPGGVAVSPDGSKVYVVDNTCNGTVSVINTATNTVTASVYVGGWPFGVAVSPDGSKVYVPTKVCVINVNDTDCFNPGNVSVINTSTDTVTAMIPVGILPAGVAVSPDGTKVYVTNAGRDNIDGSTVSVINTTTNTVTDVPVVDRPHGIVVSGTKVYVTNWDGMNVSVIDTATNTVTATVGVGPHPLGVAVTPDGTKVYVANEGSGDNYGFVSVIDTVNNTTDEVNVGKRPHGIAVTPDGTKVYVASRGSNTTYVIDTATNNVTATVPVGSGPIAFGQFIGGPKNTGKSTYC